MTFGCFPEKTLLNFTLLHLYLPCLYLYMRSHRPTLFVVHHLSMTDISRTSNKKNGRFLASWITLMHKINIGDDVSFKNWTVTWIMLPRRFIR